MYYICKSINWLVYKVKWKDETFLMLSATAVASKDMFTSAYKGYFRECSLKYLIAKLLAYLPYPHMDSFCRELIYPILHLNNIDEKMVALVIIIVNMGNMYAHRIGTYFCCTF